MTLLELLRYANEAHARFGDLKVVILDSDGNNYFDLVELELMVAEVKLRHFKRPETVFCFMAVEDEFDGDVQ